MEWVLMKRVVAFLLAAGLLCAGPVPMRADAAASDPSSVTVPETEPEASEVPETDPAGETAPAMALRSSALSMPVVPSTPV